MKHNNAYLKKLYGVMLGIKLSAIFIMIIFGIITLTSIDLLIESNMIIGTIINFVYFIMIILLINFICNIVKTLIDMSSDIESLYKDRIIDKDNSSSNLKEESVNDLNVKLSSNTLEKNKKNVESLEESLKKFKDRYK